MPKKQSGFTLVELMITVAIIAILAAIGVTTYSSAQKGARDGKRIADMNEIQNALEQYYSINQSYPASGSPVVITAITALNTYFTRGVPPTDPNPSFANYTYYPCSTNQKYIMCVALESPTGKANRGGGLPADGCGVPTNTTAPLDHFCLGAISN